VVVSQQEPKIKLFGFSHAKVSWQLIFSGVDKSPLDPLFENKKLLQQIFPRFGKEGFGEI
jgi:hypothetical protein